MWIFQFPFGSFVTKENHILAIHSTMATKTVRNFRPVSIKTDESMEWVYKNGKDYQAKRKFHFNQFLIFIPTKLFFSYMHRNGHFFAWNARRKSPFWVHAKNAGVINNSRTWGKNCVICVSTVIFSSFFAPSSVVI